MAAVGQRGQLVLVAALVIAAALVGLSVVVNTAIYTENLATERSPVGDETLQRQHEARQIVGGAIEAANRNNNSDRSALDSGLETAVSESMEFVRSRDAESGLVTEVTVVSVDEYAWRISQNKSSRTLTSAQGNAEWTVVTDVEPADGRGTRAFELNLTEIPEEAASQPLVVNTTEYNGSDVNVSAPNEWRMEVEGNVDNSTRPVVVTVTDVTGDTEQCSKAGVEKGYVHVDVTEGTIADKPCDALRTYPLATDVTDVSDSYNISFERGDKAQGTYSLVANVDNPGKLGSTTLSELNHPSEDSPRVNYAIYEVSVDVEIHSSDLSYEARLRVEVGEVDD